MALSYKFKKFRLENGMYIKRPVVNIILKNDGRSLEFWAILDSGSDLTTVPNSVAGYLGLKTEDKELDMVGYKGTGKVKQGRITIVFKGKVQRQEEILSNVPVAIMQDTEEEDVIIGTSGVFENFRIIFNDSKNISLVRLHSQ
ncbi:retropepsin-like domain-containing protein [Candidatus Woesearchaeota archaeon]|nr:retropepsin-like domain-containing protein [Candidatus Woesearchaeota archaeon]